MFDIALAEIEGAPRVRDIDLAEALGFERPRDIRELIGRHSDSLEGFGRCRTIRRRPRHGGATFSEYWLNEKQALFICTKSEARRAVEITICMVEVFADWRAGALVPAVRPVLDLPPDAVEWLALVREVRLTHGRVAARRMWAQSPLPKPAPARDHEGDTLLAVLAQFIEECCQVTGNKGDFVRSSRLRAAFFRWNGAVHIGEIGPRAWANAFRRLASIHSDALTGARFWPVKRSNTGYGGLRLG